MSLQQGFWRLGAVLVLSLFSPSLFAQNCSNNQTPIANAGPDRSGNVGVSMTFSSQGSSDPDGVLNSYWFNFGDGQFTGWQPNPSVTHSFSSAGTYSLRLWVKDNCNVFSAVDTSIITITAGGNPCAGNTPPVVQLSVPSSGVVGQSLSFSATNSSDPGGSIASYSWNFGDGSSANGVSVSKSYSSVGNFTITLTLTDNCGASAMVNASISISAANPCAGNTAPVANAGSDQQGNPNVAISFSGSASSDVDGNSTIQSYWFNFGDGSFTGWQSSASASHAFVNVGSYTVRLWVKDNCGAMSASDLALVTIAAPNPCSGNTPPNAVITSPASGLVNQVLNFSGLSSSDATGTIQSYLWNFGDGQSGSGVNVSHSYTSAGNKTVTLTVSDSCGAQGQMIRTIVISNPDPCAGNQSPIAQASANPASTNINQSISFSAAGSSDPNGSITSYAWNFGDGSNGNGLNASHAYASTGSFNVILTVTDNCGATATKTISVSIVNPNQGLTANFEVQKLVHVDSQTGEETWEALEANEQGQVEVELGLRFRLDGTSSTGASIYRWRRNGFIIGTTPTLMQQYTTANQSHQIKLEVYDSSGQQSANLTKNIHVATGMAHHDSLPASPSGSRFTTDFSIDGNLGVVSHVGGGLTLVEISQNDELEVVGSIEAPPAHAVAAEGGYVYLSAAAQGLKFFQIANEQLIPLSVFNTYNQDGQIAMDVAVKARVAALAAGPAGLKILTLSGTSASLLGTAAIPNGAHAQVVLIDGNLVYVADDNESVHVFDLGSLDFENPGSVTPILRDSVNLSSNALIHRMTASGGVLACETDDGFLSLYVYSAGHLEFASSFYLAGQADGLLATSIIAHGGRLYGAFGTGIGSYQMSVIKLDITNPFSPYVMNSIGWGFYGGISVGPVFKNGKILWGNTLHEAVVIDAGVNF